MPVSDGSQSFNPNRHDSLKGLARNTSRLRVCETSISIAFFLCNGPEGHSWIAIYRCSFSAVLSRRSAKSCKLLDPSGLRHCNRCVYLGGRCAGNVNCTSFSNACLDNTVHSFSISYADSIAAYASKFSRCSWLCITSSRCKCSSESGFGRANGRYS